MFQPEPATAKTASPRDHHVQAWIAIHASRQRPRPAVGRPLSKSGNIEEATTILALSNTLSIEPVNSKWLQGLSRFGPLPNDPCVIPNTFAQIDPAIPPWFEQLHEECVNPTEFLDRWRDDWKTPFAPLYAETLKWQRLWRNGHGTPQRGFCVRGGVMFRTCCYCDRLCVPCPEARGEILKGLHDFSLAGHNGVQKTTCRVHERYWWPGMWGDINNFVHLPAQPCSEAVALGRCRGHRPPGLRLATPPHGLDGRVSSFKIRHGQAL